MVFCTVKLNPVRARLGDVSASFSLVLLFSFGPGLRIIGECDRFPFYIRLWSVLIEISLICANMSFWLDESMKLPRNLVEFVGLYLRCSNSSSMVGRLSIVDLSWFARALILAACSMALTSASSFFCFFSRIANRLSSLCRRTAASW